MVRRRKDSSLKIYVSLMVSIAITSNITLVLLPQLVLHMAQQYRQGSREMKNLVRGDELFPRNQTSAFLGRENHLGHKNLLWRSTELLTNYARAWEICCPNMWPHKPKSKSHWCQKHFVYLCSLAFLTLRLFWAASAPIIVCTIVINFYFLYIMGWNKVLLLLLLL